jgi:hypothetical protein
MQDFRFPGPGGVAWTHRVRTYGLSEVVNQLDELRGPPDLATYRAERRAHKIGLLLLKEAATHNERTEGARTEHEWRVSVVMPDSNRNYFAEQLDEERLAARNAALQEAADALLDAAAVYARKDGGSASIIAEALRQQAVQISRRVRFAEPVLAQMDSQVR